MIREGEMELLNASQILDSPVSENARLSHIGCTVLTESHALLSLHDIVVYNMSGVWAIIIIESYICARKRA